MAVQPRQEAERLDPAVLRLAGVLVLGAMAPLLDSTIVSVALRTLGVELGATVAVIQWVGTAYLLALAMAVPITGWAAARFGAKRMWIVALTLFLAGSVLCGLAWNAVSLIAFRVLQGIGGGLMLPILQTLLLRAAGGRSLGRLMAVVTLPALLGPILGPVLGGLILDNLSWRWIFYVNVPVCLLAIVLAWRGVPADGPRGRLRLDVVGLLLLSPGLAALFYGLSQVGEQGGFGHPAVLLPAAAGLALTAVFCVRALRPATAGPLIDLRLFRERSFAASTALMFLSGISLFGPMLLLPLYYQQVRGASVVVAGLMLVPQGIGSLLARIAGSLTDRIGPRPVVLGGVVLSALGTVPFALGDASGIWLAAGLVLRGLGLSAANLAVMVGAYRGLAPADIPHASSATRIAQQVGAALGTAVLAVVLAQESVGHSAAAAFEASFGWAVALAALALVPAMLLPRSTRSDVAGG